MPTYDYVCTSCGHEMEVLHSIFGHGPSSCPVCGGSMKKAVAAPAVHFRGSGWARKERAPGKPPAASSAASSAAPKDPAASTAGSGSGESGTTTAERSPEPASKDAV